jgi:hypothetical protein
MTTHPNPCPDTSQKIENGFSISGITNTGAIVSRFFNSKKTSFTGRRLLELLILPK